MSSAFKTRDNIHSHPGLNSSPATTFVTEIRTCEDANEAESASPLMLWVLADGRRATQALSCLIKPEIGDVVMCCQYQSQVKILHVLHREELTSVQLTPPAANVSLQADELTLVGKQKVQLVTAGDMEFNAGLGKLFICTRDFIQQVQQSLIQRCSQWIKRVDSADIQASQMLKTHGAHQMITADHDVRVDAERINMG